MRRPSSVFRWNRSSTVLLSGFFFTILLIIYVWWPLAEELLSFVDWSGPWWLYMDWLLIGLFVFMSLTIVAHADLRRDGLIVLVATIGGLVIEAWGTQTNLWFYYTSERPPLWIVPAWPIATLSIDRVTRLLLYLSRKQADRQRAWIVLYWFVFAGFLLIMVLFVMPTLGKTATILAFLLCVVLIATPSDHRRSLLAFAAGAALGYFLELWGTTRQCWTYYTYQTPPFFAVLAHGMAAVAFWRTGLVLTSISRRLRMPIRATPFPGEEGA